MNPKRILSFEYPSIRLSENFLLLMYTMVRYELKIEIDVNRKNIAMTPSENESMILIAFAVFSVTSFWD